VTELDWIKWTFWVAAFNAVAAALAVVLYFAREFIVPYFHRRTLLARAVDASWCITSGDRYQLKYASQDNDEHEVMDLVLPADTPELFLHVLLKARTSFVLTHVEFGFTGAINAKPAFQYWFHPFIARGRQKKYPDYAHPSYDPTHYADYHGNYHITTEASVPKNEVLTYGFMIDTHQPGVYQFTVAMNADGVLSKTSLTLQVKNVPFEELVRCVDEKHHECFVKIGS
jgi:hypothetical protein